MGVRLRGADPIDNSDLAGTDFGDEEEQLGDLADATAGDAVVAGPGDELAWDQEAEQIDEDAAWAEAVRGGRNAGFYNNYVSRPVAQIQRGITSIQNRITEHEDALVDPESKNAEWNTLDPRQQRALITRTWPSQLDRQRAQLSILKGILREKGY